MILANICSVNSIWSLNIRSCAFTNTWGLYWGSAVYFLIQITIHILDIEATWCHNYIIPCTTLEIMNSTYIDDKSEYYGSAVCFKELAELLSAL